MPKDPRQPDPDQPRGQVIPGAMPPGLWSQETVDQYTSNRNRMIDESFPMWLRILGAAAQHTPSLPAGEANAVTLAGARRPSPGRPSKPTITPGDPSQTPQPITPRAATSRKPVPPQFSNRLAELGKTDPKTLEWASEEGGPFWRIANRVARRFAKPPTGEGTKHEVEPSVSAKELRQEGLSKIAEYVPKYDPAKGDFHKFAFEQLKRDVGRKSQELRKPVSGVGEETPRERMFWAEANKFQRKHGYMPSDDFLAIKLKDKAFTRDEVREIREGVSRKGATGEGGMVGGKRLISGASLEGSVRDAKTSGVRRVTRDVETKAVSGKESPSTPLDALLEKEQQKLMVRKFDQAVAGLTPEQRTILTLSQSNVPLKDQAAAAGLPPRTYQRRIQEVMDQLREQVRGKGLDSVGAKAYEDPADYVHKSVDEYRRFVTTGGPDKKPDANVIRQLEQSRGKNGDPTAQIMSDLADAGHQRYMHPTRGTVNRTGIPLVNSNAPDAPPGNVPDFMMKIKGEKWGDPRSRSGPGPLESVGAAAFDPIKQGEQTQLSNKEHLAELKNKMSGLEMLLQQRHREEAEGLSRGRRGSPPRPKSLGAAANEYESPLDPGQRQDLAGTAGLISKMGGGYNLNVGQDISELEHSRPFRAYVPRSIAGDKQPRPGQAPTQGIPFNQSPQFFNYLQNLMRYYGISSGQGEHGQ